MKPAQEPIVSVVVPTLNRANLLVPTLESILQQDYPKIECIVVDGGSTDGTVEILKSYGSRIKWISEPDDSVTDAINKGWKSSGGAILAFLNADDVYVVPGAVRSAVDALNAKPEVDVIYGDTSGMDLEGRVSSIIAHAKPWDLVHAVKYCDHTIFSASAFIRREILEKVNWLDTQFPQCPDHELWLRIGLIGNLGYCPKLFAYTRQGLGQSQRRDLSEYKVRLTKKFFSQLSLPPPFNDRWFKRRSLSNAYLIGSIYACFGKHADLFVWYLLRSVQVDPLNLPHITAKTLRDVGRWGLSQVIPERLKNKIKGYIGQKASHQLQSVKPMTNDCTFSASIDAPTDTISSKDQ